MKLQARVGGVKLKQQLDLGSFVASDAKFHATPRMSCMKPNHVRSYLVFILPASQSGIRASKVVEQLIVSQKRP
jgi:hypothetical protein